MTQRSAAEALGVSYVHLSNVERGKTQPSTSLVERFRQVFGVDIHVLAWCLYEDENSVPELLRVHHRQLADAWRQVLAQSSV
jgi:transcriptional regulator with XRE-family HTH domain